MVALPTIAPLPNTIVLSAQATYFREVAAEIERDIDAFAVAEAAEDGTRWHLGASEIGKECHRAIWYSFRWYKQGTAHGGRMQRLLNRGKREEDVYVHYLRGIGATVQPLDPATGKQFRISACGGHFGGSLDGKVWLPTKYNLAGPMLAEFKTRGTGSGFNDIKEYGIELKEKQHYAQACIYGAGTSMELGLYLNTNKNDDTLAINVFPISYQHANDLISKAGAIIQSNDPPPRISNSPTFTACKICDFRGVCHLQHREPQNCRTCAHSRAANDGEWYCVGWQGIIPRDLVPIGCAQWTGRVSAR